MTTYSRYDENGKMNFQIIAITGKPEDYEKAFFSEEEALEWVEKQLDQSKEWSIERISFAVKHEAPIKGTKYKVLHDQSESLLEFHSMETKDVYCFYTPHAGLVKAKMVDGRFVLIQK